MGNLSKNFNRHEFACRCGDFGCTFDTIDAETLAVLQDVRDRFGHPVMITSPSRCRVHNIKVGGRPRSRHLEGRAVDFRIVHEMSIPDIEAVPAIEVALYLEDKYPTKYGIGRYDGRTHIDTRAKRARWDNRINHG